MTFIFDFDYTLFDTRAFERYLLRGNVYKYITGFREGELDRFIYPDVPVLIETLTERHMLIMVTAGTRILQSRRVNNCSIMKHFDNIFFSNWKKKGPIIKKLEKATAKPIVYIDNNPKHLMSVSKLCPDITVLRMRRKGGPYYTTASDRFTTIDSFTELGSILQNKLAIHL